MKQVKKWIKPESADDAATFLYENGITVIFAWLDNTFFSDRICMFMAVPEIALPLLDVQKIFKN